MNDEQFRVEKEYQAALQLAKELHGRGLLTAEELAIIDTKLREEYRPVFGTLFSESACYLRRKE